VTREEQPASVAAPIPTAAPSSPGPGEPAPPARLPRARRFSIIAGAILASAGGLALITGFSAGRRSEVAAEMRDVPHEDHGAIWVSAGYRARNGITFAVAERAPLTPIVKAVGTVVLDPRRVAAVGTRVPGFVRRVFKLEGDEVRAGEPLAETESADLGEAQAGLQSALAEESAAAINARREEALLADRLTTAREAEEAHATLLTRQAGLAAARQRVQALGGSSDGRLGVRVLRSPIAGHVVESSLSVGQGVEAHKLAFRIANLDTVWIELELFERSIGLVRIGDPVDVAPAADPTRHIRGKVAHVGEIIDLASRSAEVRIQVDNRDRLLRPGQSVSAVIHVGGHAALALSVPAEAITYVDNAPTVFLAETPERIVPTKVRLGVTDGSRQEILSGLRENQRVAVKGVFALKSELFR
jgi:cobalt-zinc-cadmium efflux system membrane fusion protein